jgi:hypothetical protein
MTAAPGAELIVLTSRGKDCLRAAFETISGIESGLETLLGSRGLVRLREDLRRIIAGDG